MALLCGWWCVPGLGVWEYLRMEVVPPMSWPGCRGSWAGPPQAPIHCSFSFQILGAVILGFGVWILADRSSFISVLRKGPSVPPPLTLPPCPAGSGAVGLGSRQGSS